MWQESSENVQPLRTGLTTGTCATACALAAAEYLLTQTAPRVVGVTLPKGKVVDLTVAVSSMASNTGELCARAETIKDAGDDPDVTHGATVFVELSLQADTGVQFEAGAGVGTVTRDGLALAVGEPAINPVPRQMMMDNLSRLAQRQAYQGGFVVRVGVVDGDKLALKTMNPKLGILGGLSILGTTGIVRPFSCAAWIASIHQGIDVAQANGFAHIAASTGNASEQAVRSLYGLHDMALIEMGDFAGAVLKHLRKGSVLKLSICGGFGKISKLANGHMDLNSRVSAVDFTHIAQVAASAGADSTLQQSILAANTSIEALKLCERAGVNLADAMCLEALKVAEKTVRQALEVEILAINRQGELVGYAGKQRPVELS